MEKVILKSMTDFVLNLEDQLKRCIDQGMPFTDLQTLKQEIQVKIFLLANFLKQKLELWMFVPCKQVEDVWVVLEEPICPCYENGCNGKIDGRICKDIFKEYQEAKDRVLFDGFEYDKMGFAYSTTQSECGFDEEYMENKTIEDLVKYNLELTPTIQKQIGL